MDRYDLWIDRPAFSHSVKVLEERTTGAIEGTRTPTPLPVHGPEPCASANSATMASGLNSPRQSETAGSPRSAFLFYRHEPDCQTSSRRDSRWAVPNVEHLLLQTRIHRDLGVQHLRNRAPLLRRLGIFLKSGSICTRHFAHHVDVALRDCPS